jgi:hypothetical protein
VSSVWFTIQLHKPTHIQVRYRTGMFINMEAHEGERREEAEPTLTKTTSSSKGSEVHAQAHACSIMRLPARTVRKRPLTPRTVATIVRAR